MAFRFTEFGMLLSNNPASAHARLVELFEWHDCNVGVIAKELNTSPVQIRRWVKRLVDAGFDDPGDGERATRGPSRKKRSKLSP